MLSQGFYTEEVVAMKGWEIMKKRTKICWRV